MTDFIFDGSFEGLLTAIFETYHRRVRPEKILPREMSQQSLFLNFSEIVTDQGKADKVYRSIQEKISHRALHHALCAFLTEEEEVGTWIYQYLELGWKIGRNVDRHLEDNRVLKIHQLAQKVRREQERMLGLIRFRQLAANKPLYYAPCEPDNNIVGLIAPHFARRLADQNWVIHDVKRNVAALYNQKTWLITTFAPEEIPQLSAEERSCQDLWRTYFQHLGIKERFNPNLQKKNMPMRYWHYLVEKEQEDPPAKRCPRSDSPLIQ